MAVDIGPKIGIDGEAEFRAQIQNINQQLKTMGSEMKAVTSAFEAGDDAEGNLAEQTRILNAQIDAQEKKLGELQKGLAKSAEYYGKADNKTLKWEQAVHDATAELNRMKKQLKDTEDGVKDFDDAVDEAENGLGKFGKALVAGLSVGAVVKGVKELTTSMVDLVKETQEYRGIMGTLEVSSQNAGYTALETSEAYNKLYGVLGDTQTAATTVANLQALGMEQDDLMTVVNASIGAWAKYGDSIPIDGLAEAINETIQAGAVTGVLADVLNWAGTSEDEFNAKLEEASTLGQRQNMVLEELARQGLPDAAKAWRETNKDVVAMNDAQREWQAATGRLGEVLAPAATSLVNFGADAVVWLTGVLEDAIEAMKRFIDWFGRMSQKVDSADEWSGAPTWGYDGSHAAGLNYVPWDGYLAQLHKGEMVLTRQQAELLRSGQNGVTLADLRSVTTSAVNAMAAAQGGGRQVIEVNMIVNGKKFYQETLDDLRFVEKSNPEAVNDA